MPSPIYMWIHDESGSPIPGSVIMSDDRQGSVEVLDLKHQVEIPTDKHTGALTGTRRHHAVQIMKAVDKSSALLFNAVTTGKSLSKVMLKFYQINSSGVESEYYRMTFENVRITGFKTDVRNVKDPGADLYPHLEHIDIRYAKMTVTFADGNLTHADSWEERSVRAY